MLRRTAGEVDAFSSALAAQSIPTRLPPTIAKRNPPSSRRDRQNKIRLATSDSEPARATFD